MTKGHTHAHKEERAAVVGEHHSNGAKGTVARRRGTLNGTLGKSSENLKVERARNSLVGYPTTDG